MGGQIEIPEGKGRGHWAYFVVDHFGPAPRLSAMVWCPECGKPITCARHTISDDGQVNPSLGHPTEYPPCAWHVNPKLVGWKNTPQPVYPIIAKCDRCGQETRQLSGWTQCNVGLVCVKCWEEIKP